MPIADSPEDIPADAVDVTKEVMDLKGQLEPLFSGKGIPIVGMAIGSLIGETLDDPDAVKALLSVIAEMAATVHYATYMVTPEGATIQ